MKGIILAMLAGTLFACYQLAVKLSAHHIQEMLGAVILQAVAVVVGLGIFLVIRDGEPLVYTTTGLKFAMLAGLFVSLAEIVAFYTFSQAISPSVGITIIVGMNILVGLGLDYFWFKSELTASQMLGILLVLVGVILISWKKG